MRQINRILLQLGLMLSLMFGYVTTASAGLFDNNPFSNDGPVDVEQAFVFGSAQEGNTLKLFWSIPDDYYLYRDRMELKVGDEVKILERRNLEAKEKDDPLFGKVWVYHNRAEVDFDLASNSDQPVDAPVSITYQGCWEGGICYPPVTKEITLTGITPVVASAAPVPASDTQAATATTSASADQTALAEQDQFANMLRQDNLLVALGAFFLAGLALSFTPCVFPMIPILSSIIAGQGRQVNASKGFMLSLVYVLAVSVTYTVAGVVAGLFGENLQAMFQNPWIIGSFSLVFVALSFSMFGYYDLQLPNAIQTRLTQASNNQQGGTIAGVAIMGFLSALIVGPCMAAPLAGALIYIGQTGDPIFGGSALFSMSLGMGVPLLLVGASAGRFLPHAGIWMDKVKAIFGILLLLLAIWMLDRIVDTVVTMWLTAIVLIVSAVYLGAFEKLDQQRAGKGSVVKGVALIIFIYAAALMLGALSGNRSMLAPLKGFGGGSVAQAQETVQFIKVTTPEDLEQQLQLAKQQKQPVMLDFYADWCVSCIELEVYTFADAAVQSELKRFRLIKVDVTANDEPAKQLNKEYGIIGPPALIFFTAEGELLQNKTLIGVVDPSDFVNHISQI